MNKRFSIKRNYQFRYILKNGKVLNGKYIKIYQVKSKYANNRIGITLNKNINNSVDRNRAKRLVREAFKLIDKTNIKGYDFVFFIKHYDRDIKMQQYLKDIQKIENYTLEKEKEN